ncbi:MAG: SGNH/GDSL hydrolase family protein, partial [Cyanobacteriota bacterium]|nr:SGNH/GDSL hydrolase family protein [Cyanobacteriota bacterium]
VFQQCDRVPKDATHLFVSVGGNDTLRYATQLLASTQPATQMLEAIATMKAEFDRNYRQMLEAILSLDKPTVLCTIYDRCPFSDPVMGLLAFTALSVFNDCITRQAFEAGLPLIDLRVTCRDTTTIHLFPPSNLPPSEETKSRASSPRSRPILIFQPHRLLFLRRI